MNNRQKAIFQEVARSGPMSTTPILRKLHALGIEVSRYTLIRDLANLVESGALIRGGRGPGVFYSLGRSLETLPPELYFAINSDERTLRASHYDAAGLKALLGQFSPDELQEFDSLNREYRSRRDSLSPGLLRREFERLTIELSWKSSQIEGNTYSLLDTEALLLGSHEAAGHSAGEAAMLLNHKAALDFIREEVRAFRKLKRAHVEKIHELLVENLGVPRGVRAKPVGITGTLYRPAGNLHQVREGLEDLVDLINEAEHPLEKVLVALGGVAYVQPFEDGNKRTSRMLANALLLAADYCPLSFRSISEAEYKRAVVLLYEQHRARELAGLLGEQFRFAVGNYFGA